ncbi:MAG: hypothetical protein NWE93_04565 [Candidatus Bathyarchaeota archaeon]|nr:hypothetical protein [Candidatus Bathyarchaeota archaeon]
MRKKILTLITAIALTSILAVSSLVAVSQAWFPSKSEYVSFDFQGVYLRGVSVVDNASAPNLIKVTGNNTLIQGNLTVDGKTYSYPQDFSVNSTFQMEYSAVTGEGIVRVQNTLTFNMANNASITVWGVGRVSGFPSTATGSFNNTKLDGEFQLTGTEQFTSVNGFGLQNGRYPPPDMNLNGHMFGYIRGWSL